MCAIFIKQPQQLIEIFRPNIQYSFPLNVNCISVCDVGTCPAICLTLSSLPLKQLVIFMSWRREGGIVSSFR